jgi:uncharacterized protein YdhG (YjbR/CyaY superfamily)
LENQRPGDRSIDDYIAGCPEQVQAKLQQLRATIHAAAPDAEERISYAMPAFEEHGIVVYFAALKNHIGFYPTPSGIEAFQRELTPYVSTKGALRFPLDKPLPTDLITKIVQFRVTENLARAAAKSRPKKS